MKVSILMPTYNCPPELLVRSITSVAEQTHQDFEIIIKDGNFNKPIIRWDVVKELFWKLEEKIVYLVGPDGPPPEASGHFKHNGFYEALNQCIKSASGDILSLLCSDDERGAPSTLEYVNSVFEKHGPSPFFLYGACEWISRDGWSMEVKRPPVVSFESLLRDYTLFTPSLFWNRAVHEKFGLFDESYTWCADVDFWLRCWRGGMDSKLTPEVIGKYRVWETSQARANESSLWKESSAIQAKYRQ